jgi:MFS family permease
MARLTQVVPVGRLLVGQFLLGGVFCGAMALAHHWMTLLVLRTLVALCLGGALTLAYSLGSMIVPAESRGAAFGWLALGVQLGTAVSPLATGALAAVTLPGAYVMDAVLSFVAALVLLLGARDLLERRDSR